MVSQWLSILKTLSCPKLSDHVFPTLAWDLWLRYVGIGFFVGRGSHRLPPWLLPPLRGCFQRPCHPYAGQCGGLGSMAEVCWCWFFCRQGFTPPASTSAAAPSGLCSAAMSCRRWHVRGRASMAAVCWCCFALFPTNNIIPPTEIWRHTYFTVIHYLLYLFVFVLNNRNALYL